MLTPLRLLLARPVLVASLLLTCAACAPSQVVTPVRPILPPAPATFGQPVRAPAPSNGQDARVYAAKTAGALAEADRRLLDDQAFYADVLRQFNR